ncbi:putative integral membrane transport protein [Labilithrix luteola]|uniref:Putative integral membrane transport protein n=1 Tax=Labilithrix luteola TaxID=1391654 RepID=A0A0K1PJR7_9BACT|nr:MFS transporter [Labilithrix luteola]AKU93783.1 putative integral membrane transport protein [Labilithrix luteola]
MASLSSSESPKTTLREDLRALLDCPRELWLVYAATFFEYLGIFSFLPTLPLWLSGDYGFDDKQAGNWAALFSTLVTLFVFLVGSIADAMGVRRTLIISFGLAALTRLAMAIAPSPSMAIATLLAFGFAYATTSPVLQTAVHRASGKKTRSFAFSLWYVSFNLAGAMCGPLVIDGTRHAFLNSETGKLAPKALNLPILGETMFTANRAIMALGFVFAVIALVVISFVRPSFEHRVDPEEANDVKPAKKGNPLVALKEVLSDKPFWRFLVLLGFLSLVRMMFQHMHFTWPKYVIREQGDAFPVGTVWSVNSLLILFLAPLGTALTRNRKPFQVLLFGAFISSLSPFVLCFGSTMPYQITMILFLTIGEALWSPRLYEYNLSIAPRGREATYVSLASLPYFLAKFLVGPSSGYLLSTFCPPTGPRQVWLLWAIIGASTMIGPIGIWLGRSWMTKTDREDEAKPATAEAA